MKTTEQVWLKTLSVILTLALLISCVPNQVFAMAGETLMSAVDATRTNYEYDSMYRLKKTSATTDQNKTMSAQYSYENDLLKTLATQSTTYSFTYGDFDLRTSVRVGNLCLAQYHYTNDENHYLERLDYANGNSVQYTYDSLGRVTREEYYEDDEQSAPSRVIRYYYDSTGAMARIKDSATGIESLCYYDYAGRVFRLEETDNESFYHVFLYGYDANGNISAILEHINGEEFYTEYFYDYKNRIESVKTNDSSKEYRYDSLDRVTTEVVSSVDGESSTEVLRNEYTYLNATVDETSVTTYQVASKETTADMYQNEWIYEYDGNGNIVSICDGTGSGARAITYVYDSANQLIRENNPYANATWVWTYDGAGNITSKKEYAYTTAAVGSARSTINYGYPVEEGSWGDLLIAYNGQTLSYDGGNLISDGTWTYTWEHGRQLASMTNGTTTWNYTYDANGLRTSRTNGATAYSYVYNGSQLVQMTKGNDTLYFIYDATGVPAVVMYNGVPYYYITNLQGDTLLLVDSADNAVVEYWTDAWGNVETISGSMATTLGTLNPLIYRGYVYDQETDLYYLQSRYYDPEMGRFINADALVSTGTGLLGDNMFAYCLNNPVNFVDRSGKCTEALQWWAGGMWWLCGADAALPVGDIIYGAGILILGVCALTVADEVTMPQIAFGKKKGATEPEPPDVTYPGDDPAEAPDGYGWSGPDEQGGKRGGYANPNGKDSWHPDLDHPDGVDSHWDYNDGRGHKWRVFPDRIEFVK